MQASARIATWIDLLFGFVVVGACVSAVMIRGPVTASLGHASVNYAIKLYVGLLIVAVYVLATCGSAVLSGYRHIGQLWGVHLGWSPSSASSISSPWRCSRT